jgi:hypothetical protein
MRAGISATFVTSGNFSNYCSPMRAGISATFVTSGNFSNYCSPMRAGICEVMGLTLWTLPRTGMRFTTAYGDQMHTHNITFVMAT